MTASTIRCLAVLTFALLTLAPSPSLAQAPFVRGDTNADGSIDTSDPVSLLGCLFQNGACPGCLDAADANADRSLDISDAVFTLLWLFAAGNAPPEPTPSSTDYAPEDCSSVAGGIGCDAFAPCDVPVAIEICGNGLDDDDDGDADCLDIDCCGQVECASSAPCGELPPDPRDVAPPIDPGLPTSWASAISFLYDGENPVQRGVALDAIDSRRAGHLTGLVRDRAGVLGGVLVRVIGRPELGSTVTRATGEWDLVVNADAPLVLRFHTPGYLPVDRQVEPHRGASARLRDVVMTALDAEVTHVDLSGGAASQVARGSEVTDADGTRRGTLVVPPGASSSMRLADGTVQPLSSAAIRITEFTHGTQGLEAMPGELPPTSGYTWAAELSADEAIAAGASRVDFDPPVTLLLENFLDFPDGGVVPVGYYDRSRCVWVPSENGRIVRVVAINGGVADLSIDTNGATAESDAELEALGITLDERRRIAELYSEGQSLWRVPISHFTPWDCNWPYGPPLDAVPPPGGPEIPEPDDEGDEDDDCRDGSLIQPRAQTLFEAIPLRGVPFDLHYSSSRSPGKASGRRIDIPISLSEPLSSLRTIRASVTIAGQTTRRTFPLTADQRWVFEWDGLDAWGRPIEGGQIAVVEIVYGYEAQYYEPGGQIGRAFARVPGESGATGSTELRALRAEQQVEIVRQWFVPVGGQPSAPLGGWSVTPHHVYDPAAARLYHGDGTTRGARGIDGVVETVAGFVRTGFAGEGEPVTISRVDSPRGMAVGPDGAFYFADSGNHRIRRIGLDGIISTVAGTGEQLGPGIGPTGDGVPALESIVFLPFDVAFGPDGNLYFSEAGTGRVRRAGPDGLVTTVAGGDFSATGGDGDLATDVRLGSATYFEIARDGSIFISEVAAQRVRRVAPDGIISTYAGGGFRNALTPNVPATQLSFRSLGGLALSPSGELFIALSNDHVIIRVGPDGISRPFAGTGIQGVSGDGGDALMANIVHPASLTLALDGTLYISTGANIRRVGTDGIITTIAGTGVYAQDLRELLPATMTPIPDAAGLFAAPDGSLYYSPYANLNLERVRRIRSPMPGSSLEDIRIPSDDGSSIFVFSNAGRHLRTQSALTAAVELEFSYDEAGRLAVVRDAAGRETTLSYAADGRSAAIVGPYGHRSELDFDASGLLTAVRTPAGAAWSLAYAAGGLLSNVIDPDGAEHRYTYDALGRLVTDTAPDGGVIALERRQVDGRIDVIETTGLGRTTTYSLGDDSTATESRERTLASGLVERRTRDLSGRRTGTHPDGTVTSMLLTPDPRAGMLAPYIAELSITTPSGLSLFQTKSVEMTTTEEGSEIESVREESAINERIHTTEIDVESRTSLRTSPLGRVERRVFDDRGLLVERQLGDLLPELRGYDAAGRLTSISQGSRSVSFSWDVEGNLAAIDDGAHGESFSYDADARSVSRVRTGSADVSMTRSAAGLVTSATLRSGSTHSFDYSPKGRLVRHELPGPGGVVRTVTFDEDGLLVRSESGPDAIVDIEYDATGRLSRHVSADGTITFAYDADNGHLARVAGPGAEAVDLVFDGPLCVSTTHSGTASGTIQRAYDEGFRLVSEQVVGTPAVSFDYDDDGHVIRAGTLEITRDAETPLIDSTSAGLVTDATTYDAYGERASYEARVDGALVLRLVYSRDASGRIASIAETDAAGATTTYSWQRDAAGRIREALVDGVAVASWTWDEGDNRIESVSAAGTSVATYDARDRLLTDGDLSFSYDSAGRLSRRADGSTGAELRLDYDAFGNLASSVLPDGTSLEWRSDGMQRPVARLVDGALERAFLWRDALGPAARVGGAGAVLERYVYATRRNVPELILRDGRTYRVIHDHRGSPRLVIDTQSGEIAQSMRYDTFGAVVEDSNPGFQPFGWGGGLLDPDTGLVRFGARDYDPRIARFTAPDPIGFAGAQLNLYLYAGGDPLTYTDPDGRLVITLGAIGVAALVAGGAGAIYVLNESVGEFERAQRTADLHSPEVYREADALQHCLASCNITRRFGHTTAHLLGLANEAPDFLLPDSQAEWESTFADEYNNGMGRYCGQFARNEQDCTDSCVGDLRRGFLNTQTN